jgi:hypothetical protein
MDTQLIGTESDEKLTTQPILPDGGLRAWCTVLGG